MLKAYRYRIYPNDIQKQQLAQFFGASRFIYNLGLETKIAVWASAKKNISCFDLNKQLTDLKNSGHSEWLNDCVAASLQMTFRNLDNAYTQFFKGGGFPKFKKRSGKQSIQFPTSVKIIGNKVLVPKLKLVDIVLHRPLPSGKIKTSTLSKNPSGEYYISILLENGTAMPHKNRISAETSVGIDVGLKTFATLSDGQTFENPKYLHEQLKRLRIEQRTLSRRYQKGKKVSEQSKGYHKQKLVVAKLHQKIANKRTDFLHKVSTEIVKQFDTICMENLNISGMMQNSKLSKAISDVSWSEFARMLEYKSEWAGKNVSYIGRFDPSSKICSNCGNIFKELTLSDREWDCQKCGVHHDRDKNAAINIKNFGLRNQPVADNVKH